ncbi:MAG: phenylphosphate synthase subunit beta [Thaumarchaeota archaeon]|nr:phenylphosphate synthase subunit beta [Nitrososphaerota archaeon]
MPRKDIIWIEDRDAQEQDLVGGKYASLASLRNTGVNVPLAFCVSATAYRDFVERFGHKLENEISAVDFTSIASVERAADAIRGMITSANIREDLREEVTEAYRGLGPRLGLEEKGLPVAVRSSATAEDSPDASLAGLHETYLWIMGEDKVIQRMVDCWASVFTARSLTYRNSKGVDQFGEDMAVAVQTMVRSTTSGVMFTLNPTNGDPSKISIESSWGLGEAIVGGLVSPDLFVVDKVTFEILERRLSRKLRQFRVSDNEVVEAAVEADKQGIASISDEHLLHLAKLGKAIEKEYGYSLDIEWAIDASLKFPEDTFVLQARPETVWSRKKREAVRAYGGAVDFVVDKLIKGERMSD